MNTDFYDSVFEENIKRGIKTGIITITDDKRKLFITVKEIILHF